MNLSFENSGFENIEANIVTPRNASITELLPYQSRNSIVYKTRINDKWLLLKRIFPEFREHPVYINALEKEFNLGFNLDHPNIVKYLNKGQDSEGLYLIAEFIDGSTLRNIIQKNSQGIKDINLIERIIFQLLDALNYLHKQQIYHLDLKPENIIITHKGNNVKLIDFGLSCSDSYITVSSGTKKYCSPEQLNNPQNADARSDFYSLGLIFLELLTGNSDLSGLKNITNRHRKIIEKCIEPFQENRFNSVDEITVLLNKKSKTKLYIFSGIAAVILVCVFLGIKNFHSDTYIYNTNIINPQQKSENKLINDSTIKQSKKTFNSIIQKSHEGLSSCLPIKDSLFCCRIGDKIFLDFIERIKAFDNGKKKGYRNRKPILLEFRNQCFVNATDSFNIRLSNYDKGTAIFYKLNNLFSSHSDFSRKRIDSLIFKE